MNRTPIRRFTYRHPRFATSLSIDFVVGETVTLGVCEVLSEGGLSARFADELPTGSTGVVTLYYEDASISLHAAICGREEGRVALQFLFETLDEQTSLRALIEVFRMRSAS